MPSRTDSSCAVRFANDSRSTRSTMASPSFRREHPLSVSRCRNALDQPPLDHAAGKRSKRLIALEGQEREVVQRGARVLLEMPERVPLDQADPEWRQAGIDGSVVAHLE